VSYVAMGKEHFSYRITKNGKIFVYWHGTNGKREIVLKGAPKGSPEALSGMDAEAQQLALARATGNFKRGYERPAR
jgi:hypothetical protein